MTDSEQDERLLDLFRHWLQDTRQEAAQANERTDGVTAPRPKIGLDRLVEEFTALRQELKLQTRSSRSLEERVEAAMTTLADAASLFRSATENEIAAGSETADKHLAQTLAELDEALERGRAQWNKNSDRLIGPSVHASLAQLNELYAAQSWWQRRFAADYHQRIREQIERAEEQARSERQALLTALLNGYDLIQQRLMRAMANAGVVRIPTVGRLVDPEQMVVVEVVDTDGPPGQVVEEIRRGYRWKGGLLRPAEVRAIRPRFEANET